MICYRHYPLQLDRDAIGRCRLPRGAEIVGVDPAERAGGALRLRCLADAAQPEEARDFRLLSLDDSESAPVRAVGAVDGFLLVEIDPPAPAGSVRLFLDQHYDRSWGDPTYAKDGDAGIDLRAALTDADSLTLAPNSNALIPSGIRVRLPRALQIELRPRSGLAHKHRLAVTNSPATIDSGYLGEIFVSLENRGQAPYTVERGERIAQAVLMPYQRAGFVAVDHADALGESLRGAGGFGHSGRR
ncbi:deoxyuridine 5'-triphosphate nucleotidohydrolase [Natronocella acetinitrilica]|uniref:Deoxyuridine 5'-triphosphate nucleotidohydrolase n=1 Tax=Natronocella acetinitrilica TaxID=414046 RepID=A0AAE3G240_9GAMM|nr:dUTP diphosphatase [Natronocella acetinitrilica]MCP1674410.1 deoxyuridine 5'-triphosphate nucleotidohydrolase [Natronocella acetinitrilica]